MKKIIKFLAGLALAGMVLPASAQIDLSLSPASQTVGLGGDATYNVIISGLKGSADYNGPVVGGFDIVLDYNPAIASVQSVSFTSLLNVDAGGDFPSSDLGATTPGQLVLEDISGGSVAALEAAQGKSFTLASFTLQGINLGVTALTFDPTTSLSDENANTLDLINATGGSLSVIPEPGLYGGLAGVAACGVCVLRRKSQTADRKA
jgi:hypothetical protein